MKLSLVIDVEQTGDGFKVTNAGLQEIERNAKAAGGSVGMVEKDVSSMATSAVANFASVAAAVAAIRAGVELVSDAIKTGVQFNALLQTSQIGIAAIVAQTARLSDEQGNALTGQNKMNRAQEIAVGIQKDLVIAARETAATYGQLLAGVQSATPLAIAHGFNTKQITEFVTLASQAAAAIDPLLLQEGQFSQEIRGLFEGDMSRASRLSRIVFSEFKGNAEELRKKIEELSKSGKLFDFMRERFQQFGLAGKMSLNTLTVAQSNFHEAYEQAMGEGTVALTEALSKALNDIVGDFSEVDATGKRAFSPALISAIKEVAGAVATAVTEGAKFIEFLSKVMNVVHELNNQPVTNADVTGDTQKLLFMQKELRMGSFTPEERAEREKSISTLKAYIDKEKAILAPSSGGAQAYAALVFKQAIGPNTKAEDFNGTEAAQGKKLLDLQSSNPKEYTLAIQGINQAAKDGVVTQLEFAAALTKAHRAMEKGVDLGKGSAAGETATKLAQEKELYDLMVKRVEAAKDLLEQGGFELKLLDLQDQKERQRSVFSQLDLEAKIQSLTIDKQAVAEQDKIEKQIAETRKTLDEKSKLITPATRKKAEEQIELLYARIRQIDEESGKKHVTLEAKVAREAGDTFVTEALKTAKATGKVTVDAWNESIAAMTEALPSFREQLMGVYGELGHALGDAMRNGVLAVMQGHGLKDTLKSFVGAVQQQLAGLTGAVFDQAFAEWSAHAQGKHAPGEDTRIPITPEQKSSAQMKMVGIQSGAAIYGLYQNAQAGASQGANAVAGATQGASIGAAAGPWGAVAGAVIGAVYGIVLSRMAEGAKGRFEVTVGSDGRLSVSGQGKGAAGQIDDAVRGLNQTLDAAMKSVNDIISAFPDAIARRLRADVPDVLPEGLVGEAITKVKTFRISIFKKSLAGGMTADQLKHFNDVELPQMVYDAYAPIFQSGLKELGVTEEKLKELFAKMPGFDPKDALAKLQGFIEVLAGFVDSDTFNKLGKSGLLDKATEELAKTPIEAISSLSDKIKGLAIGFNDLGSEEQVTRGKQILDLEKQREQTVLEYMLALKNAKDALFKSIDQQIADIGLNGIGQSAQSGLLQSRLNNVAGRISTARTPQELSDLGGEAQALIGRIYELTHAIPAELTGLIAGLKGLDDILKPGKTPGERLTDLSAKIAAAGDKLAGTGNRLNRGAGDRDSQIANARELLSLAQERFALEKQMLDEVNAALKEMNSSIDKQIHDFGIEAKITALGPNADPTQVANIRISDALAQQRTLRDQLKSATTTQEVQRIVSELQQNASTLFDLMGKTPEAADQLTKMLEDVRANAKTKFDEFAAQITADNDAIRGRVTTAVGILETALAGLPNAAKEATDALATLKETLATRFGQLADEVIAANEGILAVIGGILETLRSGLDGIFNPATGTPGNGGGGPGAGGPDDGGGIRKGGNVYEGPWTGQEGPAVTIQADMGQPVVYVTLSGSAERLIDSVVATAELRGAARAVNAVAQSRSRRGGF